MLGKENGCRMRCGINKWEKPFTEEEKNNYREEARKVFAQKADYYAEKLGVTYNRIAIREQKTRWGSCSSKKNLNFNWRLLLAPEEILDYVVAHELSHLKEMNHSREFYKVLESVMPDYRWRQQWLKENGMTLWQRR